MELELIPLEDGWSLRDLGREVYFFKRANGWNRQLITDLERALWNLKGNLVDLPLEAE